jgi:hypothetical protein
MPNIKLFVFAEGARVEKGPFHFVLGSHAASASKARWLFERTRHITDPSHRGGGAFRHVNTSATASGSTGGWCHTSRACLEEAYDWQQRDLSASYGFPRPMPLLVEAGTLVVVDTSAFHFRGLGLAGTRRTSMGNLFYRCGRTNRRLGFLVQLPRVPVLACANISSAASTACRSLHATPTVPPTGSSGTHRQQSGPTLGARR